MDLFGKEPITNPGKNKVPIMTFKEIKQVNILLLILKMEMNYIFMKMDLLKISQCTKKEYRNPQFNMMKMEDKYSSPDGRVET